MQEVFVFCCVACPHFMLLWGCAILIAGWRHCMLTIASTDMLRTTKLSWNMPKITQIGSAVSNVLTIIQLWSGLVDSLFWATLYAWHSVVWFLSVKVARSWEACCSLGQVMDLVSAKRVLRRPVSIHWRPRRFPLWRHQLQASAARRAAWRGWGIQRVGRGVIAWPRCDLDARPRTAIDDCFSSAFWRLVHSWTRR